MDGDIDRVPVIEPEPIVHARDASTPLVLSGAGEGVVDVAGIGGLGGDIVLYSRSYARDTVLSQAMSAARPAVE